MVLKLETGAKLVCATHNAGKDAEIAELLDGRFQIVTAGALGLPEPEEVEGVADERRVAIERCAGGTYLLATWNQPHLV